MVRIAPLAAVLSASALPLPAGFVVPSIGRSALPLHSTVAPPETKENPELSLAL